MGKGPDLSTTELTRLVHRALQLEGCVPGERIPRAAMDDLVIVGYGVGNDVSIRQKLRTGQAMGFWKVVQAHGKGGRGHVVFDPTEEELAAVVVADPPATPA